MDLEPKLKVIRNYTGGKSVTGIALQSGTSHSTTAMTLKNENKVTEAVKGSASVKTTRLIKTLKSLYQTWRNF